MLGGAFAGGAVQKSGQRQDSNRNYTQYEHAANRSRTSRYLTDVTIHSDARVRQEGTKRGTS